MTFIQSIPFNISNINFKSSPVRVADVAVFSPKVDSFSTNPLYDKFSLDIETVAKANPNIRQILKENNLGIKVNTKELEALKKGHLKETRVVSAKIYSNLPKELKSEINLPTLQEAAMFHDYGKALIPEKILNKTTELNEAEQRVMHLHPELGYELLKDTGLDKRTLGLIKYHHQTADGAGYPVIGKDFEYGLDLEILNTADKYSALREERSYKPALSHQEALTEIRKDVDKGLVSEEVYRALEGIE